MKTKKPLHEKIILFILYLIGSPFIIGGLLLFIIIYLVIFVFEILLYIRSNYYKDIKEKYYSLITFSKSYRLYNKLRKNTEKVINNNITTFQNDERSINLLLNKQLNINEDLLNSLLINNKNNYFVLNIKNINKDELRDLSEKYSLITFKE